MKQRLLIAAAAVLFAAGTSNSHATLYTDTTGDEFTGNPHLDITSVEVTNNFADVIFKINLNGNPVAVDWGKYCIGVDTNATTGDTSANGNGWGRAISMTPNGMDFWVGTWVDGGMGANLSHFDGAFWNAQGGSTVSKTTNSVTITIPIAGLGKTYGDSFDFDIYTTGGGGGDPAIDSLANPAQTVSAWSTPYASSLTVHYVITTPVVPPNTNHVNFMVDMQIPIWEYDNSIGNGFNTNTDQVFVRGSFNGWGTISAGYQLLQVGPTLFSNTVEVVQNLNQSIDYKFEGVSFPGYESPVASCGANRTLLITNVNMSAPLAYFSDRKLSDPNVNLTFNVDMSVERKFGQFDPDLGHGVAMPGSFNGWNTGVLPLTPLPDPQTNIYTATISYQHYPTNSCNFGFYKFFISGNGAARDGGWEDPISTSSGNRAFSITSAAQTNTYYYNDENPNFKVVSVQKLDADNAKVTWQSFPSRNNVQTGGVYQVESRASLTSPWVILGTNYSTASLTSATNSGLTGVNQQYYRVSLIGLVPTP